MFTSVVQCINEAIEVKRQSVIVTGRQTVIGVLDIYGFEIFDNNRYVRTYTYRRMVVNPLMHKVAKTVT